jgi:sugar-specific transcriptional regulator TrmB
MCKALSLQSDKIKILRDLGLTLPQAKVYLAIAKIGNGAAVREISAVSNVFRQDVYRALVELQEAGLIEKIIDKKAMFRLIPSQEALDILAERNIQKIRVLQTKATKAFKYSVNREKSAVQSESNMFVLIPKKEILINRMKKMIETAQKTILVLAPWRALIQNLFILQEHWEQALNNYVKVQWITQEQPNTNSPSESISPLLKHPNFKLRARSYNCDIRFTIYDNKQAFIATLRKSNAFESPALWTNNLMVLHILKDYFALSWNLSTEFDV